LKKSQNSVIVGIRPTCEQSAVAQYQETCRNPSMSAAAQERWRGWDEYKSKHPNAKPKEFFKAKKAGKA